MRPWTGTAVANLTAMATGLLRCLTAWSLARSARRGLVRSVALLVVAGVLASTPLALSLSDLQRARAVDPAACVEDCSGICPMHAALAHTAQPDTTFGATDRQHAPGRVRCVLAPGQTSHPLRLRIFRITWSLPVQRVQFADAGSGSPGSRRSDHAADHATLPARRPPRVAVS